MHFELKDFLSAVGPTATLIFAAWIFVSFLQTRYSTAYGLYRALVAEYRDHKKHDARRASLREQILIYKERCESMRRAEGLGVSSAIVLIVAIMLGGLDVILGGDSPMVEVAAIVAAFGGLALVILAASMVVMENRKLQRIIDSDVSDLDDICQASSSPARADAKL